MYKKMIVAVLVISGILFVLSPFIKESIIINLSKNKSFELTAEQAEQNNTQKASFDFEAIQPPSFMEAVKAGLDRESKAVIGRITISSVNIKLPILKGTTNQNLLYGATTMRPDQKMGEGNYPLAGHHMKRRTSYSALLSILKKGTPLKSQTLKRLYIHCDIQTIHF